MSHEKADNDDDELFSSLPAPIVLPVQNMLTSFETINVLAPLVRCSKLPFRHLCSLYETHVTHTPMILAEEFSRSQAARVSDFTTSRDERGVFWMEPRGSISSQNGDEHPREGYATYINRERPVDYHRRLDRPRSIPNLSEALFSRSSLPQMPLHWQMPRNLSRPMSMAWT